MSDMLILTNHRILAIHSALVDLARRKLPSITVDLKVARRIESLKPALAAYEAVHKKTIAEYTDAEGKMVNAMGLQAAINELNANRVEIPAPKSKLAQADLPVDLKGDEGQKNTTGLSAIITDLGPDFFDMPEE